MESELGNMAERYGRYIRRVLQWSKQGVMVGAEMERHGEVREIFRR